MSLIGKTLAHYEITTPLGKGGMGEVYQAKDRKLGRDVAIKVLPEEFAKDADRLSRFQREAKLLASLNHPNIAAIYGLEESGGTSFLVLELVEGKTLADLIKAAPVPVEESLKLALQIAEALEAAHEKGVIHRDLKPANIKVTPDGKVKVLDFGLAKAYAGDREEVNLSNSPTLSNAATQQGVILGTAAYMSPEQARGESVDKKADVWAFGVVFFEMLIGRGMFEGRTVSDTLAAVLMREPGWKQLPPNLHPRIRLLLERCLEKDAKNRSSGIGDIRADIQKALADPGGVFAEPVGAVEPRRKLRTILPWASAALVLGLIIAGVAVWEIKPAKPLVVSRFSYELPKEQQFGVHASPFLAVSPDGRQFVYAASGGLYLRSLNELDAKLISGTDGNSVDPFFSPDGKWVGYCSQAEGMLKRIAIGGGAPVVLTKTSNPGGPIWGKDGWIVYAPQEAGIVRIPEGGGTPEPLIKRQNTIEMRPQILPNGKSVLFTNFGGSKSKIMVESLKSGERRELFEGDSAQYLPTGHIVYALDNNLFAVPFDVEKLETTAGPVSVVEGVYRQIAPQYAVSGSGTLLYVPGLSDSARSQRTLVWVTHNGKEEPLAAQTSVYETLRISPDGTKVALTALVGGNQDIWIWDFVRATMTRLTFDEAVESDPLWTPDGKRVLFSSDRKGKPPSVYWKNADGTGVDELLVSVPERLIFPLSWSKDGKTLLLEEISATGGMKGDIGMLSMEGNRTRTLLLQEKYNEVYPQISPDGRWMAYESDESGRVEVFVRPFPEVNKGRWQVSTSGGKGPRWSPDGRQLFYRNNDAVMAISVDTEPTFKPGNPNLLFRGTYSSAGPMSYPVWDISPDGQRFLMTKPPATTEAERPHRINIVLNWFEELKQRVPVK